MVAAYIDNAIRPMTGDKTPDIEAILKECKAGCPTHQRRLTEARELQDFFDGNSEKFIPSKTSEDNLSWLTRPKRISFITEQAVNKLCSHLYKPGPRHRLIASDPAINNWYKKVCQDIHVNSLMQEADKLATLHGICAIGVYPTGIARRPVNYHLFPYTDFIFWASPDDPRVATAVCVITKINPETIRYRLWTSVAYYSFFRKAKAWGYDMAGGAYACRFDPGSSGVHNYGALPFIFPTHSIPTTELETKGIGYKLRKINTALNTDMSNLALWVHHYARPLGFISGVGPEWRPKFIDGGFVPLVVRHDSTEDAPVVPSASYLESSFDIAGVGQWIKDGVNQSLAELDIPVTLASKSSDGGGTGAPSGLAIAANDADLITYAKNRQPLFEVHETNLAALICKVAASNEGSANGMESELNAVADDPQVRLGWTEPQIDLPGQARDIADDFELNTLGITDPIEILAKRQGMTIAEALVKYREVQVRRQQATVLATIATSLVDAKTGETIDPEADQPDEESPFNEDDTDDGAIVPDMGIAGSNPSDKAQPDTSVTPSITLTSVVTPSVPIAGIEVAAATGGMSVGGTES